MTDVIYDGDKVEQLAFMNSSHIDVTYAEFDNKIYALDAFQEFVVRTTPDANGQSIFIELVDPNEVVYGD